MDGRRGEMQVRGADTLLATHDMVALGVGRAEMAVEAKIFHSLVAGARPSLPSSCPSYHLRACSVARSDAMSPRCVAGPPQTDVRSAGEGSGSKEIGLFEPLNLIQQPQPRMKEPAVHRL